MTGAPYLPGFGRCGIPRLCTAHSLLATGLHVHGHLHPVHSGAEVCGIPHLQKPAQVPRVRLSLRKAAWSSWKPTSFIGNTGYGAPVIRYGPGIQACQPGILEYTVAASIRYSGAVYLRLPWVA